MRLYRDFLLPAGFLSGTIIGAGVFALPFVFAEAGIGAGFIYLALAAGAYTIAHLFYADVIVRSGGKHRFVGYAELYFGRAGFWIAVAMTILEMVFVLAIYLVLAARFANLIFAGYALPATLIFWLLGSLALFAPLKRMTLLEFLIVLGVIAIILTVFFLGLGRGGENAVPAFSPMSFTILLPLGPILFALGGRVAIPLVVSHFRLSGVGHTFSLIRRAITAGTVLPALVYAAFVFGVLWLSKTVSEDAVSGLAGEVPGFALAAIGVLGLFSLWSSYIVVGSDVVNSLRYDLKFGGTFRFILIVASPLFLYFVSSQNFIALAGIAGGVFLALEGIAMVVLRERARRVHARAPALIRRARPVLAAFAILIFAAALVSELLKHFFS